MKTASILRTLIKTAKELEDPRQRELIEIGMGAPGTNADVAELWENYRADPVFAQTYDARQQEMSFG